MIRIRSSYSVAVAALALSACGLGRPPDNEAGNSGKKSSDPVAFAQAAAPAAVSLDSAVVTIGPDGAIRPIRSGTNNFTCIADNPRTPIRDAMCMDPNGMKWLADWMAGRAAPSNDAGLIYMLGIRGDGGPGKQQLSNGCLGIGPHVMVVGTSGSWKGYPAAPAGKYPFVMSASTPYAHLIVPVG